MGIIQWCKVSFCADLAQISVDFWLLTYSLMEGCTVKSDYHIPMTFAMTWTEGSYLHHQEYVCQNEIIILRNRMGQGLQMYANVWESLNVIGFFKVSNRFYYSMCIWKSYSILYISNRYNVFYLCILYVWLKTNWLVD